MMKRPESNTSGWGPWKRLDISDKYAGSKLHHRDIVGVALRRMRDQLNSGDRDGVVRDILDEVEHRKEVNMG